MKNYDFTHEKRNGCAVGAKSGYDTWEIFRALRDSRKSFGLSPSHLQTLQAMLSFLKPGHGVVVFASNQEICRRIGGINERTLRRHISHFVQIGLAQRQDSSNKKRFKVRGSHDRSMSFGISLQSLFSRADEIFEICRLEQENAKDRMLLRKRLLSMLTALDQQEPDGSQSNEVRKQLRRALSNSDYLDLIEAVQSCLDSMSTAVDIEETPQLSANDGQNVRHLSKSKKGRLDSEGQNSHRPVSVRDLTTVCKDAVDLAQTPIDGWNDVDIQARFLAKMMGIPDQAYETTCGLIGKVRTAVTVFIMVQTASRIRDFSAYFYSVTRGNRAHRFEPAEILKSMGKKVAGA